MYRPSWQRQGKEPGYRFSLANERTFLAWIRTAMALLAGAVLLDQVSARFSGHHYVSYLAVFASAAAAAMCVVALVRWKENEIAMRNDRPLPSSIFMVWIALGFMAAAIVVVTVLASHL
jgi:putative membrane protein